LPSTLNHNWLNIQIITPPEALKASYHYLYDVAPKLLEEHKPAVVVHIGLAVERTYFAIEKGAERDGYNQYPDNDRKVFNKSETKKAWGMSPPHLESSFDLEDVLVKWRAQVGKDVDLRTSDDVGNYVCGFVYYTSLEYSWKKGIDAPVVFMHVPPLPEKGDIEEGVKATLGLIQVLAESLLR
jgi:pyroglutamyl-peptidase